MNNIENTKKYTIYQFWTGDTPISKNRYNAYLSSKDNFGKNVEVKLLFKNDIEKYILKDYPLHPAYNYLADIHKSDYLRSYFMYHYGGGYADIKYYSNNNNWESCFKLLDDNPNINIIGEIEYMNGSPIKEFNTPDIIKKLLINCYFICKKHSFFTEIWYKKVNDHLTSIFNKLKDNPAKSTSNYIMNNYGLRWAEIQGEIFHSLLYEYRDSTFINRSLKSGWINKSYR